MPALPETANLLRFVVLERIPFALLVIVVTLVAVRMLTHALDALGERFTGHRLLLKQTSAISRFVLLILASVAVAGSVFHFTNELLLAVGGSVAVAVGFAFKDLLASLMAGVILLFDRPFQVGDRIEFDGTYGEVREIGLRTVRILTLDDTHVSVPNHRFLNDTVACSNAGALDQMCVLDFWLGCGEDFETAKRLVYEAAATSRYVYLDKPISIRVREVSVSEQFALQITVKAYVLDGRYETAFGTDITERAKRAFKRAGIRTAGEAAV